MLSRATCNAWPVNEELHDTCIHCDNESKAGALDTGTTIVSVVAMR